MQGPREKQNSKKKKIVGIPRGLIFYHYPELFKTFFEQLGAKVVLSKPSTQKLLRNGLKVSSDEECFSCKVFYGHIIDLKNQVDFLFLPQFHGNHKFLVKCPKFIGLPDVIRAIFTDLPEIIGGYHSRTKKHHHIPHLFWLFFKAGWKITKNPFKILMAIAKARKKHQQFKQKQIWSREKLEAWENKAFSGDGPEKVKVALLGHSYVINDPVLSFNTLKKLREMDVEVVSSEQIPEEIINEQMKKLHSTLYFEEERKIVGTALYFLESGTIDGLLQLIPFPCGPSAISSEIVLHHAKKRPEFPVIQLVVDDNTGEAGFLTRLEAFVMTMKRKKFLKFKKGLSTEQLTLLASKTSEESAVKAQ